MTERCQVGLGVRVDPGLLAELDRVARECLLYRSEYVRGVLVAAIHAHDLKMRRIAAAAKYSGEPEL